MIAEKRIILRNTGKINPESIDEYLSAGGYMSARKALGKTPSENVDIITQSGLRGRGGAGFSTGLKLKYTLNSDLNASGRFLVCNADEGEPGTFKDRIIIENDPHLLIEGIIIAAYCLGSSKAYIYIRGEYFRSIEILTMAIEQARTRGFLGSNIFGSKYSLKIEIKQGAGSYLCGEELTLIESLEGKRGYPRIKPPYPAEKGFLNAPTLVNNVETLANLPLIIESGAEWFSTIGMAGSSGTKIVTVSGDVVKPGYFEVEMGTSLRDIIFGLAGGVAEDKKFKAALIGGAAGTFIDSSVLDTPLGFDSLKSVGAVLGSGAIIVMNDERDLKKIAHSILSFFSNESCGKCVPCRVGNKVISDGMADMIKRQAQSNFNLDQILLEAEYMSRTSLCPLGQSPVLPLKSLKKYFDHEFRFNK
jgi:NADH:ubiquinone oxidoreductase subunit F (NADH-binding)